ncbi:class I fructose-bisphosphate aldolase family protein [[Eubacterium] cellulosolvens]
MVKKTISKERQERLEKLKDPSSGRFFIISLFHGLTFGPIPGLEDINETISKITRGGASGVILNKGILRNVYRRKKRELAIIMHLSASTSLGPDINRKVLIGSVKEALFLGSTGVSIKVNIGADSEYEMIKDFGKISTECSILRVPLFAIMTPRGPMIENELDVDLVRHAVRVGAEMGADVVITNYTGSMESFKEVVKCCPVPVIVNGGEKLTLDLDILKLVKNSIEAGGAGVAIGRNVFQNDNVPGMVKAISYLMKEDTEVEAAYKFLLEHKD